MNIYFFLAYFLDVENMIDNIKMLLQGFVRVTDVAGGYIAWTENGLPVAK